MANFGNTIFAPEGEQFNTYTEARYNLGQLMVLPDGRKFRFAKAGAALEVGKLTQAAANAAQHMSCTVQTAAAIGATSVIITLGSTAATLDQYALGYIVEEELPGGHAYKIVTHPAADASATLTLTLHPKNPLVVAWTTSSQVSLVKHPYKDVIDQPTTGSGVTLGVTVNAIASGSYGWLQRAGYCSALTSGTVVLGDRVVQGGAEGAVTPEGSLLGLPVGQVQYVGATTKYSIVDLTLE